MSSKQSMITTTSNSIQRSTKAAVCELRYSSANADEHLWGRLYSILGTFATLAYGW